MGGVGRLMLRAAELAGQTALWGSEFSKPDIRPPVAVLWLPELEAGKGVVLAVHKNRTKVILKTI